MKKSKLIDITTIKFLIVGVINTLVGTGVMFVLYNFFSVSYWISSAANYVVGSIVSYFLNKYFTFQNKEKSLKQMIRFIVNIAACYLAAYGAAKPLISWLLSDMNEKFQGNAAMLAGVCGGVAEYFNLDPSLVRLLWAALCCLWGTGIVLYLVAAVVFPKKSQVYPGY